MLLFQCRNRALLWWIPFFGSKTGMDLLTHLVVILILLVWVTALGRGMTESTLVVCRDLCYSFHGVICLLFFFLVVFFSSSLQWKLPCLSQVIPHHCSTPGRWMAIIPLPGCALPAVLWCDWCSFALFGGSNWEGRMRKAMIAQDVNILWLFGC